MTTMSRRFALACLLLTLAATAFSQRSHPRLIADKADIARAKQWVREQAWYRGIVEAHKRDIDRFIQKRPIYVSPIKQVYEYKMYSCPNHDVELLYEEFRPFDHRCRNDTTEVFRGGKYDMAWAGWYNRLLASRLVWMGILYNVYDDERYASAGKEILMQFADLYMKYPTTNTILGPAHVFFGTLSESFWGTDMVYGYDLLYNYKEFTDKDRAKLKNDFFYPLAKITQQFPESASNRQLWYNNVSAAVGFLYDDQSLIDFALKGKYGFYWQLGSATPESGFWAEWSGYHFVALRGMIHLAEMARHNGIDLYHLEIAGRSMKKMFDVPFDLILPNYEFPRSKDSGGGNILEYATYYEVGYAVYKDPKYLALLNLTNVVRGKQIVGETSALGEADAPVTMFNIAPELPKHSMEIIPETSVNLEGNGFSILRNGSGKDRRYLYLDYGIMGGEHGHPDRLQIGYYANGRSWLVDPLNESYFNPNLQLWFRQSIAHITPVVDQTSQTWTNGYGIFFGGLPGFQVSSGASTTMYPGSRITRTLLQVGDYFLDLVDFISPDRRMVDWPLQSFGTLALTGVRLSNEPRDLFGHEPGIPGYDQLREIRSGVTESGWTGTYIEGGQHFMIKAIGERETRVFQAVAPRIGGFYKQMVKDPRPMPMIISRRVADSTRFAHLMHAYDRQPSVVDFSRRSPNVYVVQRTEGTDIISLDIPRSEYWVMRREGNTVWSFSGFGVKEVRDGARVIVSSDFPLAEIECRWNGPNLSIKTPDQYNRIRVYAAGVNAFEVNGTPVPVRREGEYAILQRTGKVALELVAPTDSTLYLGRTNSISIHVWNVTANAIDGNVSLTLSPDWKERVNSQLTWWGGVVNLLPLNKGTVTRTTVPARYRSDANWIEGKTTENQRVPIGRASVFTMNLDIPNDAPPVTYLATIRFGTAEIRKTFRVTQPVTGDVKLANGGQGRVEVTLTNQTPVQQSIAARLSLDNAWRTTGSTERTLALQPFEKRIITIPTQPAGYNANNQYYPARLTLESGAFRHETEHDLYAGIAHFASTPPSLDGSWRGWVRENPMTIDKPTQAHKLLLGNQPWQGVADLSAKMYAMYDDQFLYVGADVLDQTVITTWDYPRMSYAWDTDCMEVVIDTRTTADQGTDPPTPGLFRHLSMPEYRKTELPQELWRGHGAGGPTLPKPLQVQNAETYFQKTDKGYTIICRYPLSSLNGLKPQPGMKIGFDVAINDNDGSTYRKNMHLWAGFTSNQTWWDLGSMGALFFGPRK